jgi:hypothetical protein
MILLLGFGLCLSIAVFITWLFQRSWKSVITIPPEWKEGDGEIDVIGHPSHVDYGPSEHWPECTKAHPWDHKTLPIMHVDGDFIDDSNMLHCPNCGHTWSIGPDI